ncbi:MAG: adenylyl-sulfate kinase [Deltaproteobacteria bacterium]|nr:adenylyl-sulfate kinase [Deltaproteobacteria bacterium]
MNEAIMKKDKSSTARRARGTWGTRGAVPNVVWHDGQVTTDEREKLLGQKGAVLWFTGLSGSGKSTVARKVEELLVKEGKFAAVLDGDNIRHGLNGDLGFTPEDRVENIRRIGCVAKLFCEVQVITITAFISPYRADRDKVRALVPPGRFFEIFCDTPIEICEKRDPKGLYKKARAGAVADFTGITAPYEAPQKPELVLKTGEETVEKSAQRVIQLLGKFGIVS